VRFGVCLHFRAQDQMLSYYYYFSELVIKLTGNDLKC